MEQSFSVLLELPTELLLTTCDLLTEKDIAALVNTCKPLWFVLSNLLYHRNACTTGSGILFAVLKGYTGLLRKLLSSGSYDVNISQHPSIEGYARAVRQDNYPLIKEMLSATQLALHDGKHWGQSPLSIAAASGNVEMVKLLLAAPGINVNLPHGAMITPLMDAIKSRNNDIVAILLNDERVDATIDVGWGRTPLSHAVRTQNAISVQLLLSSNKKVGINHQDRYGQTPLGDALLDQAVGSDRFNKEQERSDQLHIRRLLLDHGANPNGDMHLLDAAAKDGNYSIFKHLLSHKSYNPPFTDNIALFNAVRGGNMKIMEDMLPLSTSVDIDDLLHTAIAYDRPAIVKYAYDHEALITPEESLYLSLRGNAKSVAKLLLNEFPLDTGYTDVYGCSMLSIAVKSRYDFKEIILRLLHNPNRDSNLADKDGLAPVHHAACTANETGDCDNLLLLATHESVCPSLYFDHGLGVTKVFRKLKKYDVLRRLRRKGFADAGYMPRDEIARPVYEQYIKKLTKYRRNISKVQRKWLRGRNCKGHAPCRER